MKICLSSERITMEKKKRAKRYRAIAPSNLSVILRLLIKTIQNPERRSGQSCRRLEKTKQLFPRSRLHDNLRQNPANPRVAFWNSNRESGTRSRNRAERIGAFSSLALWRWWHRRPREKRPKEWKDEDAEESSGEEVEEGERSRALVLARARVSLNLNLRFAGPQLVSARLPLSLSSSSSRSAILVSRRIVFSKIRKSRNSSICEIFWLSCSEDTHTRTQTHSRCAKWNVRQFDFE